VNLISSDTAGASRLLLDPPGPPDEGRPLIKARIQGFRFKRRGDSAARFRRSEDQKLQKITREIQKIHITPPLKPQKSPRTLGDFNSHQKKPPPDHLDTLSLSDPSTDHILPPPVEIEEGSKLVAALQRGPHESLASPRSCSDSIRRSIMPNVLVPGSISSPTAGTF